MESLKISILDLLIIVSYFIGVVYLGIWISKKKIKGGDDYFLAGRQMTWPYVGAS